MHFTTLAPGKWAPGMACDTSSIETNLYWLKLFSRAGYQEDLRRAVRELDFGAVLDERSNSIAHAVASRHYLIGCMREILFESVRAKSFPHLPSRNRCLFLVDGGADLDAAARRFGFADPPRTAIGIEARPGSLAFRGQSSLLDTGPIAGDIVEAAHRYWSGATADTPLDDVEILFQGPFLISTLHATGEGPAVDIDGRGFADIFGEEANARPGSRSASLG